MLALPFLHIQTNSETPMDSFTISIKVTPADKSMPSMATSHQAYAPTCIALFSRLLDVVSSHADPDNDLSAAAAVERVTVPVD